MYRLILTNQKSERESISLLMLVIGQLSKPRASFWNKPQGNAVLYGHGVCESFTIRNMPEV